MPYWCQMCCAVYKRCALFKPFARSFKSFCNVCHPNFVSLTLTNIWNTYTFYTLLNWATTHFLFTNVEKSPCATKLGYVTVHTNVYWHFLCSFSSSRNGLRTRGCPMRHFSVHWTTVPSSVYPVHILVGCFPLTYTTVPDVVYHKPCGVPIKSEPVVKRNWQLIDRFTVQQEAHFLHKFDRPINNHLSIHFVVGECSKITVHHTREPVRTKISDCPARLLRWTAIMKYTNNWSDVDSERDESTGCTVTLTSQLSG